METNVPLYRLHAVRDTSIRLACRRIDTPVDAAALLAPVLADCDREAFAVATLDTQHRTTGVQLVALGALDHVDVHPREVFKLAVLLNAQAILVAPTTRAATRPPAPATGG